MDDLFPEELCVAKVHRTGADQTTNCNPEIRSRLLCSDESRPIGTDELECDILV